jgi:ubiquinone/menaquinone biosynthesis C-methylase UbiE
MKAMVKMRRLPADFDLVLGDADQLPFSDEVLDAVVCMSTMHYFDSSDGIVEDFSRVLKPHGVFVYGDLSVHENDNGFFEGLERTLSKAHACYHKPSEMKRMLEEHGFCVSSILTFAYRKSYDALMEDKGRYFHVSRQTLDTYLQKAKPVEKELYVLSDCDLTLFYTVVEAQKRDQ